MPWPASRGGHAALDLVLRHPAVLGFAAAIAPSLRPLPHLDGLRGSPDRPRRVAVLECAYDIQELVDQARELREVLTARGSGLTYLVAPVAHSYHGWRHHVDRVLTAWRAQPSAGR